MREDKEYTRQLLKNMDKAIAEQKKKQATCEHERMAVMHDGPGGYGWRGGDVYCVDCEKILDRWYP